MNSESVIEVEHLAKTYGSFAAIEDISFTVARSEVFSLLGPNGAGKTTTVEILECLRKPTSGKVLVLGLDVSKEREQKKVKERIGVMPQEFNTFDLLTVSENIKYFGRIFGKRVDVNQLIGLVGLDDKANDLYKNLSGGLKQKVGIAISLVNDPELIFLDEPTAGLDPRGRREVWAVIKNLKKNGKTVFLTTHYLEEAQELSDRVTIMERGRVVAQDTPNRLISDHGGQNILVAKNGIKFRDRLKEEWSSLKIDGDDVLIPFNKSSDLTKAVLTLSKENFVDELEIRKPNLESVFLNLTGKAITEEGNAR